MNVTTIIAVALFSLILAANASAQTTETTKQLKKPVESVQQAADVYTCPMHPGVTAAAAGKCPKCGMALEKRAKRGDTVQKKEMKKKGDRKSCCPAGCAEN